MVQSQSSVISVKIPINWESMTTQSQQRLRQTVGRDTRVIRAFFGVIEQNESKLLRGKNRIRIDENKLHAMTMTALKVKSNAKQRPTVEHDLKSRFSRISANEITECRQVAVANYESYLALRSKKGRKASRPCEVRSNRRIPRRVFIPYRARILKNKTTVSRLWLELRDSLHSVPEGRRVHDRLLIPLKTSPFHLNQLERGDARTAQVFTDYHGKWWTAVAVRLPEAESGDDSHLPLAVLGIDLGVNRAACTTLLTPNKVSETRYFVQKEKVKLMKRYDRQVSELKHERDTRKNERLRYDQVAAKLKSLNSKRKNVSKEYDRVLVRQLLNYITELDEKYMLHVAIGRPKGIRRTARRGNYKGRRFRKMVHRWSFSRVTRTLQHGLKQLGWKVDGKDGRFQAVPETWTSILCWKCGRKGVRPKQSLFVCHTCGFRTNADRNGSLNIARRLIKLIPSLNEGGLGRWALPERAPAPKAVRKTRSPKRKSPLSLNDHASGRRESAVIRSAQSSLLDFGDVVRESDDDHAAARTVEKLSVVRSDALASTQEKEARTDGGIVSQ